MWDATTGQPALALRPGGGAVNAVALSSNGRMLAAAGQDGTVRVWDTATGPETVNIPEEATASRSVRFSPNGTLDVPGASSKDNRAIAISFTTVFWPRGENDSDKNRSAFSRFPVASRTSPIKVGARWHVELRRSLACSGMAFSPDGARVALACQNGTVELHDMKKILHELDQWDALLMKAVDGPFLLRTPGPGLTKLEEEQLSAAGLTPAKVSLRASGDRDPITLHHKLENEPTLIIRWDNRPVTNVFFSAHGNRIASRPSTAQSR